MLRALQLKHPVWRSFIYSLLNIGWVPDLGRLKDKSSLKISDVTKTVYTVKRHPTFTNQVQLNRFQLGVSFFSLAPIVKYLLHRYLTPRFRLRFSGCYWNCKIKIVHHEYCNKQIDLWTLTPHMIDNEATKNRSFPEKLMNLIKMTMRKVLSRGKATDQHSK